MRIVKFQDLFCPISDNGGEEDTFLTVGKLFSLDRCLLMGDPKPIS
jgi:hypothetical protein